MELQVTNRIESPNMKYSRLSDYAHITRLIVIAASLTLAACETTVTKEYPENPLLSTTRAEPMAKPKPITPLNLSLDKTSEAFVDTQTETAEAGSSLIMPARKGESRFEFGGNLLTNASVEDYVDSIDGAKVSITIKTR